MNVYRSLDNINNEEIARKRLLYQKDYRFSKSLLNKILLKKPCKTMSRPLMIHVETINVCNHNCVFCAYGFGNEEKKIMPMDLFSKIIIDYNNIGGGPISLTPSPGEIFLDPLLKERLQFLDNFPKISFLSMTTNGIGSEKICDEDLRDILKKIQKIHISIYGLNSDEYFQITRCDTYERCISSIKRIIDFSEPGTVILGFRLLYKRTPDKIDEWIKSTLGHTIPFGYTLDYTTWGSLINSDLPILPGEAIWKKMPTITTPCFRPLISIKICVNGDVSLCCCGTPSSRDLNLGSVLDKSLEAIYNSKKCDKYWNSKGYIPDTCKNCTTYISFEYFNPIWFEKPIEYIGG